MWDLQEVEVAYAPPYNSAKDPVNIAGYAAENMINGEHESFRYFEIEELLKDSNYQLLDIRTNSEFNLGTIKDSLHIDLDTLRDNLDKLDKNDLRCYQFLSKEFKEKHKIINAHNEYKDYGIII